MLKCIFPSIFLVNFLSRNLLNFNYKTKFMQNEIKARLNLKVDENLWNAFKSQVPRSVKLNDVLVRLIADFCQKNPEITNEKSTEHVE